MVDLLHHGDAEATDGLIDLAVNVHPGPRPGWLEDALRAGVLASTAYPDARAATAAIAGAHGVEPGRVLMTAGAAEAFTLLARLREWRRPAVVHPQFTEPHAALLQAGADVRSVVLPPPFGLDPERVPVDADHVVVGNPTNPTGVLHPAEVLRALRRPGRLVVVDEAFMDAVPGEPASLVGEADEDLVVVRSLTKHWSIPGIRAGYVVGGPDVIARLRSGQTPWSLSTPALHAAIACSTPQARVESERRAWDLQAWRDHLERGLRALGVPYVASSAPFVLAEVGEGAHGRLRGAGIAVRRADTFPGLGPSWVRIAARPPAVADVLLSAVADALGCRRQA